MTVWISTGEELLPGQERTHANTDAPRGSQALFQRYIWWRRANLPAADESLLRTYIHWPPHQEWPNNTVLMPSKPDRT